MHTYFHLPRGNVSSISNWLSSEHPLNLIGSLNATSELFMLTVIFTLGGYILRSCLSCIVSIPILQKSISETLIWTEEIWTEFRTGIHKGIVTHLCSHGFHCYVMTTFMFGRNHYLKAWSFAVSVKFEIMAACDSTTFFTWKLLF